MLDDLGARALAWLDDRRRLTVWLSLIVLILAAGDAWSERHEVGPDGISYLDLGNTVFAHGIRAGASVSWSPVYTWILGGVLAVVRPARQHELIVVMVINLVIVAAVLATFVWWLRELSALLRERGLEPGISTSACLLLALGVVAWVVLPEISVGLVTPDMLLAAMSFAATATLIRLARSGASTWWCPLLGVLLGAGYLVKAGFALPAIVGCLVAPILIRGSLMRRLSVLVITSIACLCVVSPFVAVLSSKEGQLEVGGYGTLNYAWDVDGVTPYLNWTGGDGSFGQPLHPTLIARAPETFAYAAPVGGSIPVWNDPAYWYEGVRARFVLGPQIDAVVTGVGVIAKAILKGPLLLLLMLLTVLVWRGRGQLGSTNAGDAPPTSGSLIGRAARTAPLWLWMLVPLAGIVTYVPLHEDPRFMSEDIAMLAIGAYQLAAGRLGRKTDTPRSRMRLGTATVVVAVLALVFAAVKPVDHVAHQIAGDPAPGNQNLRLAAALQGAGVKSGTGIVFIGDTYSVLDAYWARLDRARVVGNVNDPGGDFWRLAPASQGSRLALLQRRTGARFAVTDQRQAHMVHGWVPIAGTGDFLRRL
jgi:hypothetical protein